MVDQTIRNYPSTSFCFRRFQFVWVFLLLFSVLLDTPTTLIRANEEEEDDEGGTTTTATMVGGTPKTVTSLVDEDDNEESSWSSGNLSDMEKKRVWGSKSGTTTTSTTTTTSEAPPIHTSLFDNESTKDIPFLFKSSNNNNHHHHDTNNNNDHYHKIYHVPPSGFQITARVYTDPNDKLAHFDNDSSSMIFPYWECGGSGSTTVPIPLQHLTVQYLLGGSQPNRYSGGRSAPYGPYPQLLIPLSSIEISLDSGQSQIFIPGSVILLEDTISAGHKLKGVENKDMTVLLLTLTNQYHHVGKTKTSLSSILRTTTNNQQQQKWNIPCPTDDGLEVSREGSASTSSTSPTFLSTTTGISGWGQQISTAWQRRGNLLSSRALRKYVLSVAGLSASTILADFVGKVAPLWVAVLFGGGCFVLGGTWTFVKVGDVAIDEFEMWNKQRQLRLQGPPEEEVEDMNMKQMKKKKQQQEEEEEEPYLPPPPYNSENAGDWGGSSDSYPHSLHHHSNNNNNNPHNDNYFRNSGVGGGGGSRTNGDDDEVEEKDPVDFPEGIIHVPLSS